MMSRAPLAPLTINITRFSVVYTTTAKKKPLLVFEHHFDRNYIKVTPSVVFEYARDFYCNTLVYTYYIDTIQTDCKEIADIVLLHFTAHGSAACVKPDADLTHVHNHIAASEARTRDLLSKIKK